MSKKQTNTKTQAAERDVVLAALAQIWPEAKLGRTSNDDLLWLMDIAQYLKAGKRTMAETLNNYRTAYEDTAAYSGRLSKHNGDDVAAILAGADPASVIRAAELILGLGKDELRKRYERLNPGQQRMNGGNRIRAAFKRGDCNLDQIVVAMTKATMAA